MRKNAAQATALKRRRNFGCPFKKSETANKRQSVHSPFRRFHLG
jgi:hypothetical protein